MKRGEKMLTTHIEHNFISSASGNEQSKESSIDAILAALAKIKTEIDDDGVDPFVNIDDGLLPLDDIVL